MDHALESGEPVPVHRAVGATVQEVRALQRRVDHAPCFATEARYICQELRCRWRKQCFKPIAIWKR